MRKQVLFSTIIAMALGALSMTGCHNRVDKSDKYTKDGRLIISMRNLYFDDYLGGDDYLKELEKEFKIKVNFESYSWANWDTQVNGQVNGGELPDVFHANIDSYNFANYYKYWAEEEVIKPLPDDMSRWPNIQSMLEHTTNIDSLKLNGKLYGLPISKNTTDYSTTFSPFTYIYRRDWAKKFNVYQENDEYTWEQFQTLLDTFSRELGGSRFALGDVEWGFPSITNFYKQVPHCFAQDKLTGKYVNNYTTDEYIQGLEMSKTFKENGWYYESQNTARDGDLNTKYYSNMCGVLYENLSYSNFVTLKNNLRKTNVSNTDFNVEDATAIMKIKGPDGKYVLEGTDNWFSMTFFDYLISDNKMEKVLDVLDWLLSEEGTRYAIYGIEGYDYEVVDGEIQLIEAYWPKDKATGMYARKDNGGKYLRYLVSLGYDTLSYDPLTDKAAINYLDQWETDMKNALDNNELKVLKETAEVMWLTTPKKAQYSGLMRTKALENVMNYVYGTIKTIDSFKNTFKGNDSKWDEVLAEINSTLGK